MENIFLVKQIPTYMGNKRKLLKNINDVLDVIEGILDRKLILGDGFSGSGIVSRLFKTRAEKVYTNDIAGYSGTFNRCFLSSPSKKKQAEIEKLINLANEYANNKHSVFEPWISKHWCAKNEKKIKAEDRVYYTNENAVRIDKYQYFIQNSIDKKYKDYLLTMLLVEASMHVNTNGQFSAFYKKNGKGAFGGKTGTDIQRITQKIILNMPNFSSNKAKVNISQQDTNDWVKNIPEVDLMYFDPPYNKHPYSIYYFLLDIINNWDISQKIPDTYRGQPKNWVKSKYNSYKYATKVFEDLIQHTKAKFILVSYNNGGIIPLNDLDNILKKYGTLNKIPVTHKTYNKLKGIANYKRQKKNQEIKEYLWLLEKK